MSYRQIIKVRSQPLDSTFDHEITAYRYKDAVKSRVDSGFSTSDTFIDITKEEMCRWALQPDNHVIVLYRTGYVEARVHEIGTNYFLRTDPDGIRENNLSALNRF